MNSQTREVPGVRSRSILSSVPLGLGSATLLAWRCVYQFIDSVILITQGFLMESS